MPTDRRNRTSHDTKGDELDPLNAVVSLVSSVDGAALVLVPAPPQPHGTPCSPMPDERSSREIANRIVASADNLAYLAEGLGKTSLPDAWRYGPAFEVRLRFRTRLSDICDAELARRLDALGITGPLRPDRLAAIAERRALEPGDLEVSRPWRPRGFGLWRLDDGTGLGVKAYASSRPSVDLLLAVPPCFLEGFSAHSGFAYWRHLAERPQDLDGLTRLCGAILKTVRRAQPVTRIEAVHLQDQAWCDSFRPDDRGFMIPEAISTACGWAPDSTRDGWASISLDEVNRF